jgi:GT2 family glycosyltransferase
MATAVLDLDLTRLPPTVSGLDRHAEALILIRWNGHPVGQVRVPVRDGRIETASLREALVGRLDWAFWERWLHAYLNGDDEPVSRPATIAICTRERPDDLRRTLAALENLPDDGQEVLVIDNAPATGATRDVVDQFPRVRYVLEPHKGLDVARNRALREAGFDIVVFNDDDAVPDPGWLRALMRHFDDPTVLCVTGLTMPLELETEAQEVFERHSPFGRGFRRRVFDGIYHDPLSVGQVGAGANMALRRSVVTLIGQFDEALDSGTLSRTGGDHEMFIRILAAGYRIVYEPDALSWHRHRRTWDDLRQTLYGYGTGVYAMWTRSLTVHGEFGVLKRSVDWFFRYQMRDIGRSLLRRPGSAPLDLLLAELRGCAVGPWAYFAARRQLRRRGSNR